jgi:hypothetical protein
MGMKVERILSIVAVGLRHFIGFRSLASRQSSKISDL